MTAPNFFANPRFQREVRKRYNIDPRLMAIPQSNDIMAGYGAEQGRKEAYGLGRGAELENRTARLGLGKRRLALAEKGFEEGINRFNQALALDREALDTMAGQNRMATGIGIANLGISGLGAYADIKESEKEADTYKLLADSFLKRLQNEQDFIDFLKQGR